MTADLKIILQSPSLSFSFVLVNVIFNIMVDKNQSINYRWEAHPRVADVIGFVFVKAAL